jgi:hypothetical protein
MNSDVLFFNRLFRFVPGIPPVAGLELTGVARKP